MVKLCWILCIGLTMFHNNKHTKFLLTNLNCCTIRCQCTHTLTPIEFACIFFVDLIIYHKWMYVCMYVSMLCIYFCSMNFHHRHTMHSNISRKLSTFSSIGAYLAKWSDSIDNNNNLLFFFFSIWITGKHSYTNDLINSTISNVIISVLLWQICWNDFWTHNCRIFTIFFYSQIDAREIQANLMPYLCWFVIYQRLFVF